MIRKQVVVLLLLLVVGLGGFIGCVSGYDNGAPGSKLPVLGWSSWVALGPEDSHPVFDYCDEFSVKSAAKSMVDLGFVEAGYTAFHLDDCWADVERNASGYLQGERDHFPNGMKPVVDYVHSLGLTFGLYTCAGSHTCVGGRPGSKDHSEKDAAVFSEWGVDWVKQDNCNTDGMGKPEDYFKLMSAALNATGRPITFAMCEWGVDEPWTWGYDISQSWRMGGDHTGIWSSTKSVIRQSAAIPAAFSGKPYGWNDMDMLETGNYEQAAHANGKESNMTAEEYRTEFAMWAISASPLVVTTPIMNCTSADSVTTCTPWISDLQKEILFNKEIIAINQDVTPQGRPVNDSDISVWSRKLTGGDVAIALYNEDDETKSIGFSFSDIGLSGPLAIRDLWAHKDLGTFQDSFGPVQVAPHAATILRLSVTKSRYTPTPHGYVLSHCVHEIENGAEIVKQEDHSLLIRPPGRASYKIDRCKRPVIDGEELPVFLPKDSRFSGLPADYDGWLQYAALNVSKLGLTGSFDAFTNIMTVPDVPKERPQVLYAFPGLQNIDWIPKVDPEPSMDEPFDILQPVLQYPGGLFSSGWQVKSWYVTVHSGALYSKALDVSPGDAILCNMTRTDEDSWEVSASLQSDPSKSTTQKATASRLAEQPWAYNGVVECYGCDACHTFPTKPMQFKDNKLYQNGKLLNTASKWTLNPKPAAKKMCNERTHLDQAGDATVYFV